jgi:MFS family permease
VYVSPPVFGTGSDRTSETDRTRALVALAFGTIALLAGQLVISPLLPTITDVFGVASGTAGAALTAMWGCAALSMYPGGRLSDSLGRRPVLVVALVVASVGLGLAAVAPTFSTFVLALSLIGVGIGLYEPTSMATVADLFAANRGRAYGVVSASYNVGSGVAAVIAIAALAVGGWRTAFLPAICGLLLVAVLLHRLLSATYAPRRVRLWPGESFRRVFVTTELRYLLVLFCVNMFLWQGSISFFPTLLQVDLGVSPTLSTAAFASIFAIGLVLSPVVGALGDRFGHRRVGLSTPVVGLVGLGTLLVVPTTAGLVVGTALFAVGMVAFWPVMTADLIGALGDETMGADYGLARALFYGFGSLGPTYVGLAAERTSFVVAYAGLGGCFLVSAVAFARIVRFGGSAAD